MLFDILYEEILIEVLIQLQTADIINFSLTGKYAYNLICSKTFRNKLSEQFCNDSLDLSSFSLKQLYLYSKVYPLKKKMNLLREDDRYILNIKHNDYFIKLTEKGIKQYNIKNFNKIITMECCTGGHDYVDIILTNDGKIYENCISKYDQICIPDFVIDITHDFITLNIITKNGKYYNWQPGFQHDGSYGQLKEYTSINIIQKFGNLYLTDNNKIYTSVCSDDCKKKTINDIKHDKINNISIGIVDNMDLYELNTCHIKIKSLLSTFSNNLYFCLSTDNKIYRMTPKSATLSYARNVKDVSNFNYLDYNGDVFNNCNLQIKELSSIKEICVSEAYAFDQNNKICAIDENDKLHILSSKNNVDHMIYDLNNI